MSYHDLINLLLNPSVTFIIGILTVLISRNSNRASTAKERLEKIYHPLFLSIEPFLYKIVSYQDILPFLDTYNELEKTYSLLISPSLRQAIHYLSKDDGVYKTDKYGNNEWFSICDYVSKEYDKLCKQSHIPVRSVRYRINYKQYRSKISILLGMLWLNLPAIIVFSVIMGVLNPILLLISYSVFGIFLLFKIIECL